MTELPLLAAARRREAGLARAAGVGSRCVGEHAGPGQLGDARPSRFRRRRVVHPDVHLERRRARRHALARTDRQHRGSVGQRIDGNGRRRAGRGGGGGRGGGPPVYALPAGTLKAGANVLTVRITNGRNEGGFLALPDAMHVDAAGQQVPLAGPWKFRVERQTNAAALYAKPGELSAHVAWPRPAPAPPARRPRCRRPPCRLPTSCCASASSAAR